MSTLRSALDELRVRDMREISDHELVAHVDEVERTGRIVESERARAIAELERRGAFTSDGHLSLSSWLAGRHGISHSAAAAHVRRARALEQMLLTGEALAQGEVSSSAVDLLVSAREACPEPFAAAEENLVDVARTRPVAELKAPWRTGARRPTPSARPRTRSAASSAEK